MAFEGIREKGEYLSFKRVSNNLSRTETGEATLLTEVKDGHVLLAEEHLLNNITDGNGVVYTVTDISHGIIKAV